MYACVRMYVWVQVLCGHIHTHHYFPPHGSCYLNRALQNIPITHAVSTVNMLS